MLETKDLILRDIRKNDFEKHLFWLTEETEWWNWDASCWYLLKLEGQELEAEIKKRKDALLSFIEMISKKKASDTRYSFEIENKQSGELIGWISCYCINENYETTDDDALYAFGIDIPENRWRSSGFGFQAFSTAIEYYKSNGLKEVYTQTWSGNIPMIRLAEKIGFELVDVKKEIREHNGKKYDALTFRI